MALPSTNLWVHQVANELGESSNDIGRLCKSSKINPWSKFKPVIYPAEDTIGVDWWKATDGKCGFVIPSDISQLWSYAHPSGTTSPFRLHDFRGYDHNAYPFVVIQNYGGETHDPNKILRIFPLITPDGGSSLGLNDFAILSNPLYVAAMVVSSKGGSVWGSGFGLSSEITIDWSQSPFTVTNAWTDCTLTITFFLTNQQKTFSENEAPGNMKWAFPSVDGSATRQWIVPVASLIAGIDTINVLSGSIGIPLEVRYKLAQWNSNVNALRIEIWDGNIMKDNKLLTGVTSNGFYSIEFDTTSGYVTGKTYTVKGYRTNASQSFFEGNATTTFTFFD